MSAKSRWSTRARIYVTERADFYQEPDARAHKRLWACIRRGGLESKLERETLILNKLKIIVKCNKLVREIFPPEEVFIKWENSRGFCTLTNYTRPMHESLFSHTHNVHFALIVHLTELMFYSSTLWGSAPIGYPRCQGSGLEVRLLIERIEELTLSHSENLKVILYLIMYSVSLWGMV